MAPKMTLRGEIPSEQRNVHIEDLIDMQETAYLHVKKSIEWYLDNGPVPTTMQERWRMDYANREVIFFLIVFQVVYSGENSLSPWQINYLCRLHDFIYKHPKCLFCSSVMFTWCHNVVP